MSATMAAPTKRQPLRPFPWRFVTWYVTTWAVYKLAPDYKVSLWWAWPATWGLLALGYFTLWLCILHPLYFSRLRHIPTVPGFPLWGHFFSIISEECGLPQRPWHRKYGPIIRYYFPFGAERLSIADDAALKYMTVKNPYNFPKPSRAAQWMQRILGNGVLLAEGADHVLQRKALTHGFSTQSINDLMPAFWEKSLLLGDMWRQQMEDAGVTRKPIEVLEWLNRCTLDIIARVGFGIEIDCLRDQTAPIRRAYQLVFNFNFASRALHGIQAFFPWSKHLPVQMNRDMEEARDIILGKATEIIKERLDDVKNNARGKDILALMAKENMRLEDQGREAMSFDTMRDQVMTFLGAGHDTTATGVVWTLHLLSIYPKVQTRLREEIRQYMPYLFDTDGRHDAVKLNMVHPDTLPYLSNVCRESLRYIPPIPLTVREVKKDCTLGGYDVPAGTIVYVLANAINRLESFWGDTADEFDPDRWDKLPETATTNAFMTFLQGPRGCIGRKFAETEMKVMLCTLLSMFEFERDYATPDPEQWYVFCRITRQRNDVTDIVD
jgi:cytochrome P450